MTIQPFRSRLGGTLVTVTLAPLFRWRLDTLLTAGLGADERARLALEGSSLPEEEAFRQALGNAA